MKVTLMLSQNEENIVWKEEIISLDNSIGIIMTKSFV